MIKRNLVIVLLLTILATTVAGTAHATFRTELSDKKHKHKADQDTDALADAKATRKEEKKQKKLRKKQEKIQRKKEKRERHNRKHYRNTAEEQHTIVITKRPEDDLAPTQMKLRYRVDILAPMYLDELVKGDAVTFKNKVPEKAEQGLDFYEGITIAADSLKKAGFKISIYVHDITSAAETPDVLIAKGKLDSTDLIIGNLPPANVATLAAFAKSKQVNFISMMTPADGGVKDNMYLTLTQPSLKNHCEWIVNNAANQFPGAKVTVLYRNTVATDDNAYRQLGEANDHTIYFNQLACNTLPTKESLATVLDTTRPNIVMIPVLDAAYADSLLRELSHDFPGVHFEVYGMPSWTTISDLRKERALPNMSITLTVPYRVDQSALSTKYVDAAYKKDYGSKTTEMVYRGYETMFWYANLLKEYGNVFNTKYAENNTASFPAFDIKLRLDKNGKVVYYENKHVFPIKYEGGIARMQ